MFEFTKTTREQGDIGLTAAIFHLSKIGMVPIIPITDNNRYDIVVEINGEFRSVQVKTTKQRKLNGYVVELKRVRPNRTKNNIHSFDNSSCDYLFVLTEMDGCYMIPSSAITTKNQIVLNSRFDKYKLS